MANQVNPPRGMRDFLPAEKSQRDQVLGKIVGAYRQHGFQEIETPALEDLSRLTSGQGGDNEKLAFRVMKRGEELEKALGSPQDSDQLADLGLRFDLTVPLTRFYASNHAKLPRVFKAIQTGPVWRAERPQKGRYRQFVQCDIDIIGEAGPAAEIELLIASLSALAEIGLQDAQIRLNHRSVLALNVGALGVSAEDAGSAMITIDKLDKLAAAGVVAEMAAKFGSGVALKTEAWLAEIADSSALALPNELTEIWQAVATLYPGRLVYDPTLVRGMGYYTGAIFEIAHPESGSAIGGGGRYDGMVGRWLGTDVPAVGISIGFERAMELISDSNRGVSNQTASRALLLIYGEGQLQLALAHQRQAIAAGWIARLEAKPKKLNLLLEAMAVQGFTHFAQLTTESQPFEELDLKPIS